MEALMDGPLLSVRTTLVFLLALLVGATAGGLTALAGESTPRGLLAGLAAAGLAVPFFNRLIDTEGTGSRQHRHTGAGVREGDRNG
jgi:transaldolase